MNTETEIFLKYKRPSQCWVCSECEAENNMLLVSCSVCGEKRKKDELILQPYNEKKEEVIQENETFILNYMHSDGSQITSELYEKGAVVELPEPQSAEGLSFAGWFLDYQLTIPVREVIMDRSMNVYAAWEEEDSMDNITIILIILLIIVIGAILIFLLQSDVLAENYLADAGLVTSVSF